MTPAGRVPTARGRLVGWQECADAVVDGGREVFEHFDLAVFEVSVDDVLQGGGSPGLVFDAIRSSHRSPNPRSGSASQAWSIAHRAACGVAEAEVVLGDVVGEVGDVGDDHGRVECRSWGSR